jgi:hypothetical protein
MGTQTQMSDKGAGGIGIVNDPQLDAAGRGGKRAITDPLQAANIVRRLEYENRDRNLKNARIMAKYNSERPYRPGELHSEGLGWKSNFSTKPLASLIDKVSPRFLNALDSLKSFTSSSLPSDTSRAAEKNEAFQTEITEMIRRNAEWRTFIGDVAQENALFGYTCTAWTTKWDWMPKHFRQDSFFVPTGTKQYPDNAQIIVLRETFLPHELFEMIEDREAAEMAGWDFANCVEAINSAMPIQVRSKYSDWARIYEDLNRESSMAYSFYSGAKVVLSYCLLVREHTGKVTQWRIDGRTFKPLFHVDDAFDSMQEAAVFFSFQHGNGTMHGSKGIGREVYNLASVIDRARNEVVDRLHLSGKIIVQGNERDVNRFRMSVIGGVIYIPSGFQIQTQRIDGDVEPFISLDQYIQQLMDQIVGNVSPTQFGNRERVTKGEIDLLAARQEETKDTVLARFLIQFSMLITQMQQRMCDPEVADEVCQKMQKRLLKIMTREELDQLAKTPSADVVRDYTEIKRQQVAMIATENAGNPLYNQKELQYRKLTAQVDADFANAVLLPDNDPTVVAENVRQQKLEMMLMEQSGLPVEVSPRDNHEVHLEFLQTMYENNFKPMLAENPQELIPIAGAVIGHAKEHIAMAGQVDRMANMTGHAAYWREQDLNLKRLIEHEQKIAEAAQSGVAASPGEAANIGAGAVQGMDANAGAVAPPAIPPDAMPM